MLITPIKIDCMKLIISIIIVLLSSLNSLGLQPKTKQQIIPSDTLQLPESKADRDDIAVQEDYKHCIDLTKTGYIVVLDKKQYSFKTLDMLARFIEIKRSTVIKRKICIIADTKNSYKEIVDALDIMTVLKIKKYKLAFVDGKMPGKSDTHSVDHKTYL